MSVFQYQKFYHNEKTGQAFGVVCKEQTALWGKCMVIEAFHWDGSTALLPMPLEMEQGNYHEIGRSRFLELKGIHEKSAIERRLAAKKKRTWFPWWGQWKKEKPLRRGHPRLEVLKGGKVCAGE